MVDGDETSRRPSTINHRPSTLPPESAAYALPSLPLPVFGLPTTVKVDIQPVPGETKVNNNTAEYNVIFSLG